MKTNFKGLMKTISQGVVNNIKESIKVSANTTVKKVANEIKKAVVEFKENLCADSKNFKESVIKAVKFIAMCVKVNGENVAEIKDGRFNINYDLIEQFIAQLVVSSIGIIVKIVLDNFNVNSVATE